MRQYHYEHEKINEAEIILTHSTYEHFLSEQRIIDENKLKEHLLKEKLLNENLLKDKLLNEQLLKEQALKYQEEAELLADENTDNEASETESNAESKGLTDDLQDGNSDTIDA